MTDIDEIKNFAEQLFNKKKNDYNFGFLSSINFKILQRILLDFKHYSPSKNLQTSISLFHIVNLKSSEYLIINEYDKALRILDLIHPISIWLLENNKIDFPSYIMIKVKHTQSLVLNNYILKAILSAKSLYKLYKDNRKELKEYFKKNYPDVVYSFENFSSLLIYLKSLYKFMKRKCIQSNYLKDAAYFHVIVKKMELTHLKLGNLEKKMSDDFLVKPQYNRYYDSLSTIWVPENLNRFQFFIKKYYRILFNLLDKYFWGYGESIVQLLLFSFSIIFIFALLMQFNSINIVCSNGYEEIRGFLNYLYFSIVTFTSLGYGDIKPMDDGHSRILMSIEALIGISLISLIIFLFGKKSNR